MSFIPFRLVYIYFYITWYLTNSVNSFDLVSTLLGAKLPGNLPGGKLPDLKALLPQDVLDKISSIRQDPLEIEKILQKLKPSEGRFDPALLDILLGVGGGFPAERSPNKIPIRLPKQPNVIPLRPHNEAGKVKFPPPTRKALPFPPPTRKALPFPPVEDENSGETFEFSEEISSNEVKNPEFSRRIGQIDKTNGRFSSKFRQGDIDTRKLPVVPHGFRHITDPNIRNHRLYDGQNNWSRDNYENFTTIDTMEDLMADESYAGGSDDEQVTVKVPPPPSLISKLKLPTTDVQSPWYPLKPSSSTQKTTFIVDDTDDVEPSRNRELLKKSSNENKPVHYEEDQDHGGHENPTGNGNDGEKQPGDETQELLFKPSQVDLSFSPPLEFFKPGQDFYTSTVTSSAGSPSGGSPGDFIDDEGSGKGNGNHGFRKKGRKRTRVRTRKRLQQQQTEKSPTTEITIHQYSDENNNVNGFNMNGQMSSSGPSGGASDKSLEIKYPDTFVSSKPIHTKIVQVKKNPLGGKPNRHVKVIYHPPKYNNNKKKMRKEYYYDSPGSYDGVASGISTSSNPTSNIGNGSGNKMILRPENSAVDSMYDQVVGSSSNHRPTSDFSSQYDSPANAGGGQGPLDLPAQSTRDPTVNSNSVPGGDYQDHYLNPTTPLSTYHGHHHNNNNNNNQGGSGGHHGHNHHGGHGHHGQGGHHGHHGHHNHHGGGSGGGHHGHHNHHGGGSGGGHHGHHGGHGHHHNHHQGGHQGHHQHHNHQNHHQNHHTAASSTTQHMIHAYDPHYEVEEPYVSGGYITEVTTIPADDEDSWVSPAIVLGSLAALTVVCAFLIPSFLSSFTGKESQDKNDIIQSENDLWAEVKGLYQDILSIVRGQGYNRNLNIPLPDHMRVQLNHHQNPQLYGHHGHLMTTTQRSSPGGGIGNSITDTDEGTTTTTADVNGSIDASGGEEIDENENEDTSSSIRNNSHSHQVSEKFSKIDTSTLAFGVMPLNLRIQNQQNQNQSLFNNQTTIMRLGNENWTQIPLLRH